MQKKCTGFVRFVEVRSRGKDKQSKRFICEKGHQGDAYLNVARNAAKRCLEQFQKKAGKEKNVSAKKS